MMEEPLTQFFIWWDGPDGKEQAVREQESVYRIAQRAFAAGHAARYEAPYEPSRDALTAPRASTPVIGTPTGRISVPEPPMQSPIRRRPVFEPEPYVVDADPFPQARFTGPQQAAMDSLYPLPAPRATQTVWDGKIDSPPTLPMKVVPADLPVRGPVEDIHGQH